MTLIRDIFCLAALTLISVPALADEQAPLRITKTSHEFIVQTASGPISITRKPTPYAVSKGFLQPLIPQPGVTPVSELDVLQALNDPKVMVIDMRDDDEPLQTIPNTFHIPYNEVEDRMAELSCTRLTKTSWDCTSAPQIIAFCNGPMCVQSPVAIAIMVKLGFPVEKISYYRGGMMDWQALGLTTVTGHRNPRLPGNAAR